MTLPGAQFHSDRDPCPLFIRDRFTERRSTPYTDLAGFRTATPGTYACEPTIGSPMPIEGNELQTDSLNNR